MVFERKSWCKKVRQVAENHERKGAIERKQKNH
jgi:hypothetical protein